MPLPQQIADQVATDETAAAGNQDVNARPHACSTLHWRALTSAARRVAMLTPGRRMNRRFQYWPTAAGRMLRRSLRSAELDEVT